MPVKVLILRFSSIGDIVLTSPVIRCLHHQLSDAEIHYATKKQYHTVLAANPFIHKIHILDHSLDLLIKELKKERFDLIIDLHNNLRTFKIKMLLGVKSRTFNKLNFKKWLLVNLRIDLLPRIHIVDRYMRTVAHLGVVNDGMGLNHFISPSDVVDINSLPSQFHNGYIAVVIGALHYTKRLPLEKLIELCTKLQKPVLLIGGKGDAETGEKIVTSDPYKIYNACGKYSLNQSASLIKQAQIVITHDTGMMHIAAAYKKNIYSVWGNTIPEFGMYPYTGNENDLKVLRSENRILEINGLSCRPCSKIGFERCPKGHFKCMRLIEFTHISG